MTPLRLAAEPGRAAETRLILLPGAYQQAADFLAAGFAAAAAKSPQAFDLVLPQLDLAQLASGQALPLLEPLILAARADGVRRIWLGGVSLGGFNSLCYAADFESRAAAIDGLCLLAPWPGSRISRRLIDDAGGIDRWSPSPETLASDAELRVWDWLRRRRNGASRLPIWLGWGESDRFAGGINAYAELMPEARLTTVAGGHDWPTWSQLWQLFCAGGVWTS